MTQTNYTWPHRALIMLTILLPATGCGKGQRLMKLGAKQGSSKEEITHQPEVAAQVLEVPHDGQEDTCSPFDGRRLLGGMPSGGGAKEGYLGSGGDKKKQSARLSTGALTSPPAISNTTQKVPPALLKGPSIVPVFGKLQQGEIASTEQLIAELSDPEAKDKAALLRLFKAYSVFFNNLGMAQVEPEYIYEYSTLAKVTLPQLDNPTQQQKRSYEKLKSHLETYTEVWRKKVEAGFLIKKFTQGVVAFLKHIDVQAFGRDTTLLRNLGQSLLEQLPESADAYTADQYPSHKDTLSAIEQAFIKIRAISADKLDPQEGFYQSFKERLDKIMAAEYYPVAYQAYCIAQNLTRMEKAPSNWEQAGQAASRIYAGFKGLLQVTQGILGAVYFDLDLEEIETGIANIVGATLDAMDAVEEAEAKRADCMAKVLGATKYRTEPWYEHTQTLLVSATACLLPEVAFDKAKRAKRKGFAAYKDYEDYQKKCFARYQGQADALMKKHKRGQLAALQYGMVQHLTLIGMQAQSGAVRKACTEMLIAKLNDTAWHQEQGVIEALLSGLKNISDKHGREVSGQAAQKALEAMAKAARALAQQQEQAAASSCFGCCNSSPDKVLSGPPSVYDTWTQRRRSAVTIPAIGKLFEKVKQSIARSEDVKEDQEAKQATAQAVHRRKCQKLPAPAPIPFFVGREDTIKKIMAALKDKGDKPKVQLLCGPGGMGKSQLAIQLFNKLEATGQYDHVFWLRAEKPPTLRQDYLYLADKLNIRVDKKDPNAIRYIREILDQRHCLYVFDDAPTSEVLEDFLPNRQGHVLITSRNSDTEAWSALCDEQLSLAPFDKSALLQFAQQRGCQLAPTDTATLQYLLKELSGYPLALAQFFSFCKVQRRAPAQLVKELQGSTWSDQQEKLLQRLLQRAPREGRTVGKSMLQVLQKSMEALASEAAGKKALAILDRFAYLDPRGIPEGWALQLANTGVVDETETRDALALLEKYSLAKWDGDNQQVHLHAITQRMVRYGHEQQRQQQRIEELIKSLVAYCGPPGDMHKNASRWIASRPHGEQLYKRLNKAKAPQQAYELALHLYEACGAAHLYQESNARALEALALAEKYLAGTNLEAVAKAASRVGTSFARLGNIQEAVKYKEQALAIRQRLLLGRAHPEIAHVLRSIGELYAKLGRHQAALKRTQEALKMMQTLAKTAPKQHDRMIARLHNGIGVAYEGLGKYEEALQYKQKALAMREQLFGNTPHADLGHSLHNVGETLIKAGKLKEGLDYCRKALKLRQQRSKGKPDPHVAHSMNWVGIGLTTLGKAKEGYNHSLEALMMLNKIYCDGPHAYKVAALRNIGVSLSRQGQYQQALRYKQDALKMQLKLLGRQPHPDLAYALSDLGTGYSWIGNYEEALKYKKAALQMRQQLARGQDDPEVAYGFRSIGELLSSHLKRHQEALEYQQKALAMRRRLVNNQDHPEVARLLNGIGVSHEGLGDLEKALASKKAALAMRQRLFKVHPDVAHSLHNVGETLIKAGSMAEGIQHCEEALKMRQQLYQGQSNPHIANSINCIGIGLTTKGEFAEGLARSEEALKLLEDIYGSAGHPYMVPVLCNLIASLRELGRELESVPYQQRLDVLQKR